MAAHDYRSTTREAEAGKSVARLGCIVRTCLKRGERMKEGETVNGGGKNRKFGEKKHLPQRCIANQRLRHNLHSGLQTVT